METASVSHDEEHQHAVISFADGAKVQQKAWRTVFHSLSDVKTSSEMPRHADAPGTSYSVSKPIDGLFLRIMARRPFPLRPKRDWNLPFDKWRGHFSE